MAKLAVQLGDVLFVHAGLPRSPCRLQLGMGRITNTWLFLLGIDSQQLRDPIHPMFFLLNLELGSNLYVVNCYDVICLVDVVRLVDLVERNSYIHIQG